MRKHVPFPAVGLQLHLQAVVGEPLEPDRSSGSPSSRQISAASSGWALPLKTRDLSHVGQGWADVRGAAPRCQVPRQRPPGLARRHDPGSAWARPGPLRTRAAA
mgnify:CR=1 FL=1